MSLWGQHDAGWLGWADAFGRSTPEPDGSSKRYFARVPGTTEQPERRCRDCGTDIAIVPQTAHEAVAWGYRRCVAHYAPAVMT